MPNYYLMPYNSELEKWTPQSASALQCLFTQLIIVNLPLDRIIMNNY